jgi:hypothetical protein
MQADSSEASADFSQKLYEQLRFDDVWNKRRLTWYIKASQKLVNRSVVEKLWLFVHATQILGILWINMSAPLAPNFSVFFLLMFFFSCRCQGELRWPSDFCSQCARSKAVARLAPLTPRAASFLRYAVLDIPSLISWAALSSSSPGPHLLYSNSLLWWALFLFPSGSFVCYQWAVFLHRRFTARVNKMPFFHRLVLALTSLFYVPILFVQLRHVTCSSYRIMPAPVLFEGCSAVCVPVAFRP